MARRPNYGFEKRQRELRKQKKKEAKAERKRLKREAAAADGQVGGDGEREPGTEGQAAPDPGEPAAHEVADEDPETS